MWKKALVLRSDTESVADLGFGKGNDSGFGPNIAKRGVWGTSLGELA